MSDVAKIEAVTEKARAAAEELREATREANGLLKDLRAALKESRAVLERELPVLVMDRLAQVVKKTAEDMDRAGVEAVKEAKEKILARFDQLQDQLLNITGKPGAPSMDDIVLAVATRERLRLDYPFVES